MRKLTLLAALAVPAVFAATSLSAQAETRTGFYVSGGGGYGSQTADASSGGESQNESGSGATYYAQLGWLLNQKWAIGAEWNYAQTGCGDCGSGQHITNSFYSAALTWFPMEKNNFFAKINLGYGGNEISGDGESASEMAFSGGIGVGFDWAIGKGGFIVKPFANYFTQFSKGTYGGFFAGDDVQGTGGLFQVGVGIGYKH